MGQLAPAADEKALFGDILANLIHRQLGIVAVNVGNVRDQIKLYVLILGIDLDAAPPVLLVPDLNNSIDNVLRCRRVIGIGLFYRYSLPVDGELAAVPLQLPADLEILGDPVHTVAIGKADVGGVLFPITGGDGAGDLLHGALGGQNGKRDSRVGGFHYKRDLKGGTILNEIIVNCFFCIRVRSCRRIHLSGGPVRRMQTHIDGVGAILRLNKDHHVSGGVGGDIVPLGSSISLYGSVTSIIPLKGPGGISDGKAGGLVDGLLPITGQGDAAVAGDDDGAIGGFHRSTDPVAGALWFFNNRTGIHRRLVFTLDKVNHRAWLGWIACLAVGLLRVIWVKGLCKVNDTDAVVGTVDDHRSSRRGAGAAAGVGIRFNIQALFFTLEQQPGRGVPQIGRHGLPNLNTLSGDDRGRASVRRV